MSSLLWLTPRAPRDLIETRTFSAKSPLYAASAHLERKRTAEGWSSSTQAQVKIPFRKALAFDAFTARGPNQNIFHSYSERTASKPVWTGETQERLTALGRPVCAASDLVFAIEDQWDEIRDEAALFFVLGHRLQLLRVTRQTEALAEVRSASILVAHEITRDAQAIFQDLHWASARSGVLEWNDANHMISAIKTDVPYLGSIRVVSGA